MNKVLIIGGLLILSCVFIAFVLWPEQAPREPVIIEPVAEESLTPQDEALVFQENLVETSWVWQQTTYTNSESVVPSQPGSFVLSFIDDVRFGAQTDCNNIGGAYALVSQNDIVFEQMVATRMACMNETQEAEFTAMLSEVTTIAIGDDNLLTLGLPNGEMIFEPL